VRKAASERTERTLPGIGRSIHSRWDSHARSGAVALLHAFPYQEIEVGGLRVHVLDRDVNAHILIGNPRDPRPERLVSAVVIDQVRLIRIAVVEVEDRVGTPG